MLVLNVRNEDVFTFEVTFKNKVLFTGLINEDSWEIHSDKYDKSCKDTVCDFKDKAILMNSLLLTYEAVATVSNFDKIIFEGHYEEEDIELISWLYNTSYNELIINNTEIKKR